MTPDITLREIHSRHSKTEVLPKRGSFIFDIGEFCPRNKLGVVAQCSAEGSNVTVDIIIKLMVQSAKGDEWLPTDETITIVSGSNSQHDTFENAFQYVKFEIITAKASIPGEITISAVQ